MLKKLRMVRRCKMHKMRKVVSYCRVRMELIRLPMLLMRRKQIHRARRSLSSPSMRTMMMTMRSESMMVIRKKVLRRRRSQRSR